MSMVAIENLSRDLAVAQTELEKVTAETKDDIERGSRARRRLDAARLDVVALEEALGVLQRHEVSKQEPTL